MQIEWSQMGVKNRTSHAFNSQGRYIGKVAELPDGSMWQSMKDDRYFKIIGLYSDANKAKVAFERSLIPWWRRWIK